MIWLYNELLYRPLLNILVFFYQTVAGNDLGVAIILLTILVRAILFPIFHRSIHHTTKLQTLQPKLKKIQEEHKGNKDKEVEATLALFREHGTSPFAAFGLTLVQLPGLIALYQVFGHGLASGFESQLYTVVPRPEAITPTFLGLINLQEPHTMLTGTAAIAQYVQGKLALPKSRDGEKPSAQATSAKIMTIAGPVITILILLQFPAALALYWIVNTLATIAQQAYANRTHGLA